MRLRRQPVLFLIAILVPCAVLVGLGLKMIEQERQLEGKRLAEDRQILIDRTQQELLTRLEGLKLRQITNAVASGGNSESIRPENGVTFVAPIVDGRLRLPWERNSRARQFREWLEEDLPDSFAVRIRAAETLELVANRFEESVREYRAAIGAAAQPAQQSYARLLLARTLAKSERQQESQAEYAQVLASSPDLVDEHGIPIGLYAAPELLAAGKKSNEIRAWIRFAADRDHLLPTEALRMARDLADALHASDSVAELAGRIQERDHAEALERDLQRLLPTGNHEPVWTQYGEPAWLVSVTPIDPFDELVVAVDAASVLETLSAAGQPIRLAAPANPAGQSMGSNFPNLRVVLPPSEARKTGSRQTFLVSALLLALVFTLLTGYLVWRDVQRDLRLSTLRAQFVSSVSHEFKTPLTAIRMFAETLRLDDDAERETRMAYLDTILHESERLSRLVDNVLDLGKIERGQKSYRLQPIRLEDVIEQAARAAQYPLEQAGFTLEVETERDLPPVKADSDALQQAILNLLTNAMKYSGDSRRIALRLDRQNGHACIHVVDHGIGIAPVEQARIFERFYRAPTAENEHIPGTGLGLTIVSHIVNAHGGAVEVASRVGSGSAFTMRLPLGESS